MQIQMKKSRIRNSFTGKKEKKDEDMQNGVTVEDFEASVNETKSQ